MKFVRMFVSVLGIALAFPAAACVWSTGENADWAVGQPDMIGFAPNQGSTTPSAKTLALPEGVLEAGGKFFVADSGNNRVLVYNSPPVSFNAPADFVIGQPDKSSGFSNNGGLSDKSLDSPVGVATDGTLLFIADAGNNRVLGITVTAINADFAPACLVIGQPDFLSNSPNNGGIGPDSLNSPWGLAFSAIVGKLFVADRDNGRVLVFNSPLSTGMAASYAIGQASMISSAFLTPSSQTMDDPTSVACDGVHVAVCDSTNSRVLVYNAIPSSSGAAADEVLGQPDFFSINSNEGGAVGAQSLKYPEGVFFVNSGIAVADTQNHRVLIWNAFPSSNNANADIVLGQQNFTSNGPGTAVNQFRNPSQLAWSSPRLIISDSDNSRVMIYDCAFFPTATPTPSPSPTITATFTPAPPAFLRGQIFSYPNPGRSGKPIHLVFEPDSDVHIEIYDWSLRRLLELNSGQVNAGLGLADWDGRDDSGRDLPAGLYFILVKGSSRTGKGKLSLVGN